MRASLILGSILAVYHYIGLAQVHRSVLWIASWSLGLVAARVITTWLYNNTDKRGFAAALFHMTLNVTWQLFPINGSYFDPRVNGALSALVAVIVIVAWGPRTLARNRRA